MYPRYYMSDFSKPNSEPELTSSQKAAAATRARFPAPRRNVEEVAQILGAAQVVPRTRYPTFADLPGARLEAEKSAAKLRDEIGQLQKQLDKALEQLRSEKIERGQLEERAKGLASLEAELQQKLELQFLLTKVTDLAHQKLQADAEFRNRFIKPAASCLTFVLSMDLRRSTELMLKARAPELFADFMTVLCGEFTEIIKGNFGVVDKFTGDGVLAFFPEFFSGPHAGYHAIATAEAAHKVFAETYREHRSSFTTILTDVGMGIGLDYGDVRMVQMAGGLTVVGPAVVYACRMGSAPAGKTYLNQPAYEKISDAHGKACFINETKLDFKHEGGTLAYELRLTNDKPFTPDKPVWLEN